MSTITDRASPRLTSGFASAFERAMEAMPKRRSALAMVRPLLSFVVQESKPSELLCSIILPPDDQFAENLGSILIMRTPSIPRDHTS